jgi:hypothetical protein
MTMNGVSKYEDEDEYEEEYEDEDGEDYEDEDGEDYEDDDGEEYESRHQVYEAAEFANMATPVNFTLILLVLLFLMLIMSRR